MNDKNKYVVPNVFVIGAGKCGTTSVWSALKNENSVCVSIPKEPDFFSIEKNYCKGLKLYNEYFSHYKGEEVVVDFSTTYGNTTRFKSTPKRIKDHVGNAKIAYIVRNPFKRMESDWKEIASNGRKVPKEFNKAVRRVPSILLNSYYWSNIYPYIKLFGRSSVEAFSFERLFSEEQEGLRLLEFMGVALKENPFLEGQHKNASDKKTIRRGWAEPFSRIRVLRTGKNSLPQKFKELIKRYTRFSVPKSIEWENDVKEYAISALDTEMDLFCEEFGFDKDQFRFPY